MDRLDDVLAKLKKQSWTNYSGFDGIAKYVRNGDDATLRALPAPGQYSYWTADLTRALSDPDKWTEQDARLAQILFKLGAEYPLWEWLGRFLSREPQGGEFFDKIAGSCKGWSASKVAASAIGHLHQFVSDNGPTSLGRYLLALSAKDLARAVKGARFTNSAPEFVELFLDHAPDRLDAVLPLVLDRLRWRSGQAEVLAVLLQKNGVRYEKFVSKRIQKEKDIWAKFRAMQVLHAFAPDRHRTAALAVSREALSSNPSKVNQNQVAEWMADKLGEDVVQDLTGFARKATSDGLVAGMAQVAESRLGDHAVPILEALLTNAHADVRAVGVESLIRRGDARHETPIEAELREGLGEKDAGQVLSALALASKWKPAKLLDVLWGLLEHQSKSVRQATGRVLASLGESTVDELATRLTHKKADVRLAAAEALAAAGSGAALAALEDRLDKEPNEDVRDQMLFGLETAWAKQGREVSKADIAARMKRISGKLEQPVADWLPEQTLPALKWTDGERLSIRDIRYMLYRQSRAKETRPDPEAAAVYRLLDRSNAGPFAAAVLTAFLKSKQDASDHWALSIAGVLGDDSLVPALAPQVRTWVENSRGKMAERAVQALALLGTDSALLAVDAFAIRYRSKMKNVGRAAAESFAQAAERMGITPDELGDRVVPWLCFSPDKPRHIDAGQAQYEVRIGPDFKLRYHDAKKGKTAKSLPKSASIEVRAAMKEVAATLREVIKAQTLRLENLLVRQRRWPLKRWRELFLQHPVLLPFATRLIWGVYDNEDKPAGLFRALEDRTLTTSTDDAYNAPEDSDIGLVHPLEIDDAARSEWLTHLADYEIEPPFPQFDREVVLISDDQHDQKSYVALDGTSLNGMTFKGRAERLGWVRGSVVDAGGVSSYHKSFPAANVDVLIGIEGMFMGMDMYDEITLGPVYFVRDGEVTYGSYEYDEPGDETDGRVLRFGDVPAIAFSEAMGDLRRIAGDKSDEA